MMLRQDTRMRAAVLREIPELFIWKSGAKCFKRRLNSLWLPLFSSTHKENQLTWNSLRWILLSNFLVEMSFSCFIPVEYRHKDLHVEQKH